MTNIVLTLLSVGQLALTCPKADAWRFAVTPERDEADFAVVRLDLTAPAAAVPPRFDVGFCVPQRDMHHKWTGRAGEGLSMPPNWGCTTSSRLASGQPLVAFLNDNDRNRLAVSVSEALRTVSVEAGLREEDCSLLWKIHFFGEAEAPLARYSTAIRIDRRDVFFGEAIREGSDWIRATAGLKPAHVPDAAYEPLYSTWYAFHQNVQDADLEEECAMAAKLGMKVIITDDGWQTEDGSRGYRFCGDWRPAPSRFPDMAAHVAKVHALGMKYMIWYGVPMMGLKSENGKRFEGKYLYTQRGQWSDWSCLDPRFPEVRAFLCDLYEKAMRDWDLDGLKLDFIDAFGFRGTDPAIAQNYAGRDIRSLSEAVDRLLKDVHARLVAVKPDALVEFRQSYTGPAVCQYGNMMRAADCPGDVAQNRIRTANLRLTCGGSAVHADMLEWHPDETPESAARFILATLFSTIQYSMRLKTLPADHRRMVTHWMDFAKRHRETLLKGEFRPHHPECGYSWIEATSASERIVVAYAEGLCLDLPRDGKQTFVVNATGVRDGVSVRGEAALGAKSVYDTFGAPARGGVVPPSGYAVYVP